MKRSQAEKLIDDIRALAVGDDRLSALLASYGLRPLAPCGGEAHSNAFIDNCMRCAHRWVFVGKRERVT